MFFHGLKDEREKLMPHDKRIKTSNMSHIINEDYVPPDNAVIVSFLASFKIPFKSSDNE